MPTTLHSLASTLCGALLTTTLAAAAPSCEVVDHLPDDVLDKRVLIFGEIHGTNEAPAIVARIACSMIAAKKRVVVALEVSADEQPLLDHFMSSQGTAADVASLFSGRFSIWKRPTARQDGRSSEAMLTLIEKLRTYRDSGYPISILAADMAPDEYQSDRAPAGQRDASMARRVAEALRRDEGTVVIGLFGNVHASVTRGSHWDPEYEPAGYLLQQQGAYTVNIAFKRGTAWACMPECKVQEIPVRPGAKIPDPGFYRLEAPTRRHQAMLVLDSISASPPAMKPSAKGAE